MTTPIMHARQKRRELLLILATGIFLALAINFAVSYASALFATRPLHLLLTSILCLVVGALLLNHIVFRHTEHLVRIRGAIAYAMPGDTPEPIHIIGYRFNDDFCRFLRAFILENKAYAKFLSKEHPTVVPTDRFDPDNLNHHTIVNSVVEFTLLHKVQLHLNSYFIENELDRGSIVHLARDELGPNILKNRVIDQLTRDMTERPAFSQDPDPDPPGVIVSQIMDGAIYERLELELPPKSTIARNSAGHAVITNPVFELALMPKYEGYATTLPNVLIPSQDNFFQPQLVSIKIRIRVKPKAVLTNESMDMYEWLDSLVEVLHDYISTDRLTQRLDADWFEILSVTKKSTHSS